MHDEMWDSSRTRVEFTFRNGETKATVQGKLNRTKINIWDQRNHTGVTSKRGHLHSTWRIIVGIISGQ